MSFPSWAIRTPADELAIREGCFWDEERAEKIVTFAEAVFKPQYISGKFHLLEWQKRFLQSLVAWRRPNGNRRWKQANLHVPKKQGKTLLTSILCLNELFNSDEPSALACACAASRENASQIFDELSHTITRSAFAPYCDIVNYKKLIVVKDLNSKLRTMASDGDRVHGEPTSLAILDECHAMKTRKVYDAMRYNIAARKSGLCVLISTSGNNVSHWYHDVYNKSKNILSGKDLSTIDYAEVWEAEPESDPEDETQWDKACPSIDVSFSREDFRRELQSAKTNKGDFLNFRRLRLNTWLRADEYSWLDVSNFESLQREMSDEELKNYPAYIGVDLSTTTEPSSAAILFALPENTFFIRSWAWVARKGVELREKIQLPQYSQWISTGELSMTDGDMIDHDLIKDHILELCRNFDVRSVNFDPTSATVLMREVADEGYEVGRFPQSARHFNAPMRHFEQAYKDARVFFDTQAGWLKYCLSNVVLSVNNLGEYAPNRRRRLDHQDGAVAALLAMRSAIAEDDAVTGVVEYL